MRTSEIIRQTTETDIHLTLTLEGTGKSVVSTGCGFLDHMLTLFARHGRFDLNVTCKGDTWIDDHHTVEDIGICLGQAFAEATGNLAGVNRYGNMLLPMDEALILCAIDLSGRSHLEYALQISAEKIGTFDTQLAQEFFLAFVRNAGITLHLRQFSGINAHHILEAAFKAFGRALAEAVRINPELGGEIPSSKGVL